MATRFTPRLGAAVIAGSLLISTLAGCGTTGMAPVGATVTQQQAEAAGAQTLKKALKRIHDTVFLGLDIDGNNKIDEYEAGTNLSLKDFARADKNKNHYLTKSEFVKYAVTELFFFRDTPQTFYSRFRGDLMKVFARLDSNRDRQLVKSEVSNTDLRKLRLTFEYGRLGIKAPIQKCSPEAFAAADKTGDGKLGQAEFEDLYIELVIEALGGKADEPNFDPVDPGWVDPPPAVDPGADPGAPAEDPSWEW